MKILLFALVTLLLLGGCTPGAWPLEVDRAEAPLVRTVYVEVPVIVEVPVCTPDPPVEFPPYQPPITPPAEPPGTDECRVRDLPPRSAVERIVKCPGQGAEVVKRP